MTLSPLNEESTYHVLVPDINFQQWQPHLGLCRDIEHCGLHRKQQIRLWIRYQTEGYST